jgi:hypothetical protein
MKFNDVPYRGFFTIENDWNCRWMKDSPVTATDGRVSKLFWPDQEVEIERKPKETDFVP